MAAGLQRLFGGDSAPGSPAANGPADAPAARETDASALQFKPVVPPWHLRNARALIAAAALGAVVGAAFVAFKAWQLYFDPLDRVLAARVPPVPDPVTPALEPVVPQPAPEAPRAAPPVRAATPARAVSGSIATVSPAPGTRAPVTHTLREAEAAPAAGVPPVASGGEKPEPAQAGCREGVAALGLCASEAAKEAR